MSRMKKVSLCILGLLLITVIAFIGNLVIVTKPRDAAGLHFAGFVPLPRNKDWLSLEDYLTVNRGTLYVTSISSGAVYEVPLSAGKLPALSSVKVAVGAGRAHGVVIDPVSKLAFVTRSGVKHVDVFNPKTLKTLRHIDVARDPDGIFYDPIDKLITVANGDAEAETVIDPAKMSNLGTIPLGGSPEFAVFDPATKLLYQNLSSANTIAVIDVAKRKVVARWPLTSCHGPTSAALDSADQRLFVVCGNNALLSVVDLDNHRIVSTIPIGAGPDSVAYDPATRRIYSTGRAGLLAVVQQTGPNDYHKLDSVHLHYGAHTLAIDPVNHRLYVAYASLFNAPRLAVFDIRQK